MPFRIQRRVDFCDTDQAGIVHFSNFFRYMEAAEVAYLRARNLNVHFMHEDLHLAFPRVSVTCDYLKPAKFEDLLDIDVRLDRLGSKSVTYAFTISRAGETLANGKMTSVCCQVGPDRAMTSIEFPAGLRALLQAESA